MPEEPDPRIADMDEQVALPRKNGELVFAAPWEARAFGIAVARGLVTPEELDARIAEYAAGAYNEHDDQAHHGEGEPSTRTEIPFHG